MPSYWAGVQGILALSSSAPVVDNQLSQLCLPDALNISRQTSRSFCFCFFHPGSSHPGTLTLPRGAMLCCCTDCKQITCLLPSHVCMHGFGKSDTGPTKPSKPVGIVHGMNTSAHTTAVCTPRRLPQRQSRRQALWLHNEYPHHLSPSRVFATSTIGLVKSNLTHDFDTFPCSTLLRAW